MGATGKPDLMGSRSRRGRHGALPVVLLWGLLLAACSDNKGPAGPSGTGQTGHADTTAQIRVQVAVNPNTIELGRRAGITVLVTNLNGRPLEGRHVQLSTDVGKLDVVDGVTDRDGKFTSALRITEQDALNAAGLTVATVTAFVEGAVGTARVNFGKLTPLVLTPSTVTQSVPATGATCASVGGFTTQFTVSGGVPPYTFTTSGFAGSTISGSGLYTFPLIPGVTGGFKVVDTVTVTDSAGQSASATITVECVKSS